MHFRIGRDSKWQDRDAQHVASILLVPTKSLRPIARLHPQAPALLKLLTLQLPQCEWL
jgi:hypothetical protein